ncbi:MAG: YHS domain protein [Rhodospirillales bacterium]|nr:YHS domain protein [Rhodospirillales bacterium]
MDRRYMIKSFGALLMATGLLLAMPESAVAKSEVNASFIGSVAIEGTDPVAYFTEGKAEKGLSKFNHSWKGATWRFKSAANQKAFAADPEKYAPQFGGYCAWAVSQGYTAAIDPEAWTIHGGKLYLNFSKGVQAEWAQDIPGNIAKGEKNWPQALEK